MQHAKRPRVFTRGLWCYRNSAVTAITTGAD